MLKRLAHALTTGFMSGGCLCCAKYGSEEQRREHAKWILRTLRAAAERKRGDAT